MTGLVILGAGGLAREVHDIVEAIGEFEFLGFVASDAPAPALLADRGPHLGDDSVLGSLPPGTRYAIAIGAPAVKAAVDRRASGVGLEPAILVHPRAVVGRHGIILGPGTIVAAGATVTTDIRTGRHVMIDRNSVVGHDAVLHDFVHVGPLASISGAVVIGERAMIGTGAAIIQGITIGEDAIVGAGAGVVRDVPPRATVVGLPARPVSA